MRISSISAHCLTLALFLAPLATIASAKESQLESPKATIKMAHEMEFNSIIPGVSRAVLWGDPHTSAHGAMTRFEPGITHPLHYHTHDVKVVVLKGAYIYQAGDEVHRITAGSYIHIPGGTPHISGSDPNEESVFMQESPAPFDINFIETP